MFHSRHNQRLAMEQRRQLHARIARSRRRINHHTTRLIQGGILSGGWQQRIQDHPVIALGTAAGAGMLLAQLTARCGVADRSADWLAKYLAGGKWSSIMQLVESFLATDVPKTASRGDDSANSEAGDA